MPQNVIVPPFTEPTTTVVGGTSTTVFPFDFPFWESADILVYKDNVLQSAGLYTVAGLALQDGEAVEGGYGSGTVTFTAGVSDCTIKIDRMVVGDRDTQFSRAVPLDMRALNGDLNRVTARQQDLDRLFDRAIVAPYGTTAPSAQDIIDDAAAAEAAAAAAAASESAAGASEAAAAASESATAADAIATAADAIATAADRVQTGLDRVATGNDATATAADAVATAADRVATGDDATATAADAVSTAADAATATTQAGIATTKAGEAADSAAFALVSENNAAATLAASALKANNLSDLASASTARTNLAVVGTADLAASTGAALVGSIASGAGATARTVQAKLRDAVRVEDFGAVGDGSTNDTAAIQAAIDAVSAAGGGVLSLGPKTYIVTNTSGIPCLTAKSNVALVGSSTTIKIGSAAGSCAIIYSGSAVSNFSVDGITFDGNNPTVTTDTRGIRLEDVTRLTVDRCVFQAFRQDDILLGQTTRAKQISITNSIFQTTGVAGVGANGIRVYNQRGLVIDRCYFYDFIFSPIDTNPTVGSADDENYIIVTNNYLKNGAGWLGGASSISLLADHILCQGNTVIGGGPIIVHDYIASGETTRDHRIIGNSITGAVNGIVVNQGENSDIIVTSNVLKGFGQFGIQVINQSSAATNPTIISSNILSDSDTDYTYTTSSQPACILIYNANNVLCIGNQCIRPRFAGIWVGASSEVMVNSNYIVDHAGYAPSDLTSMGGGGILVSAGGYGAPVSMANVTVAGNLVQNSLTTWSGAPATSQRAGAIAAFNDTGGAATMNNIVLTNNVVDQVYGVGVHTNTLESCFVDDNVVTNASSGAVVDVSSTVLLQAKATVDPASLATAASTTIATITVTGAVMGDQVEVTFSLDLAGARITAWVSATNTVSYFFTNVNGTNPLDLGSGTLKVRVRR